MVAPKGPNGSRPRQCRFEGCGSVVTGATGYCFNHDPERAGDREAARRRGGQNHANVVRMRGLVAPRLRPVLDRLETVLVEVHEGRLPRGCGAEVASVARALVLVLQAGQLEERVRRLEQGQNVEVAG